MRGGRGVRGRAEAWDGSEVGRTGARAYVRRVRRAGQGRANFVPISCISRIRFLRVLVAIWNKALPAYRSATARGQSAKRGIELFLRACRERVSIGLSACGLDPCMGFIHVDTPYRDSLALDVLETIRPSIEAWLLAWIMQEPFRRSDFFETGNGNCRLEAVS